MDAAGSSSDLPLKPLPEEAACLTLVADAEKWVARVKKLLQVITTTTFLSAQLTHLSPFVEQGSAVRKGSKLLRIRALCEEGAAIPVSFESELRPLRAAVEAAEAWEAEHGALLLALRLHDDEHAIAVSAEKADAGQEGSAAVAEGIMVALSDLQTAAVSAEQLVAEFDSARYTAFIFLLTTCTANPS